MQYMLKRWWNYSATALSVTKTALVTATVVLAVAGSAFAQSGIMLQIKDAPLKEVIMLLTQQSGANIVIADQTNLEKKVTLSLTDVSLEKALSYVVKSAGISYKKMEDGTYIIGGSLDSEPVISPSDIANKLPPVEQVVVAPPRESIWTTIKLVHSQPSQLLRLFGWNGQNPMPNCEADYSGIKHGKSEAEPIKGGVYLNNNSRTYDVTNGVHMENGQPVVPMIDPGSLTPGAGRTDPNSGAAQYVGAGTGYTRGTSGYNPTGGGAPAPPAAPAATSNNANGDFLWPDGVEQARPFDLDNSIIVKGDVEGIEKFKKIVRMLDVPPKQVQIKAEFVEVKTTDVKRFGIDWSLERLNESFNTAFGPVGNVIVGFASGNLTASLKAQLTQDIGRVINSPIISTINNQNAVISINQMIPYWVTVNTVVGDNQIIQQSNPQFITVDTHLNVLPRVNGDGTITMYLEPGVSDTGQIVSGPDGSQIPEQRTQQLVTQRRVANGETIVIGGFIRKNETNSIMKIPILGDLPLVGSLFRTTAKVNEDRELLIFVTPTIIPDASSGTVGGSLIP